MTLASRSFRFLVFILLLLAACTGPLERPELGIPGVTLAAEADTPTSPEDLSPDTSVQTVAPDPLQFVLPVNSVKPESAWRPPLYPIPWALSPHDHFYFARPIAASDVNIATTDYQYGGKLPGSDVVHTGVDIPAKPGTNVLAAAPGQVIWAGWGFYSGNPRNREDPYGIAAVIRHDFGYKNQPLFTVYAHLQEVEVAAGQWLDTGDLLGFVGDTGLTTGPHLHFEVRLGENDYFTTRNPELWLVPPQGWGVLAARIMSTYKSPMYSSMVIVRSLEREKGYILKTYGPTAINSDAYYNENLVLGDLPAGMYLIRVLYYGRSYELKIEIFPGRVTFFTFQGYMQFNTDLPPTPTQDLQIPPAP